MTMGYTWGKNHFKIVFYDYVYLHLGPACSPGFMVMFIKDVKEAVLKSQARSKVLLSADIEFRSSTEYNPSSCYFY